jgi:NAD(P)-dependent dehydrogenase (short-subunit alcohol dehydrogenase family)
MGVVVVTGAAGALGGAVTEALVARGDRVAAVVSPRSVGNETGRRAPPVDAVAKKAGVLAIGLDAWPAAVARIEAELGAIDGAVFTAGAWAGGAPVAEAAEGELRAMLDANLVTAHAALRGILPGMIARKKGSIVVIGSRAAVEPRTAAGSAAYAASKAAAVALAEVAAAENLAHGVRVNAVLPSTIDTPQNRKAMPHADASHWVSLPSLAGVILFLLSDAARDISGAAIPVYGRA